MSLNQDNVLGDREDLSPSDFPSDEQELHGESGAKKSSPLVMWGGIAIAVLMVAFFVWKIFIAPYVGHGNDAGDGGIQPIPAASPQQPAPVAQTQPQLQQPAPTVAQSVAPVQPASAPLGSPQVTQPAPQVAPIQTQAQLQQGEPVPQNVAPSQAPAPAQKPAAAANSAPSPTALTGDDSSKLIARIDNLEKSLAAIQDRLNHLSTGGGSPRHLTEEKPKPAKTVAVKPSKSRVAQAEKIQPRGKKDDGRDTPNTSPIRGDMHLKAVLDGRAWFQTKGGESITVSPGEEVRGIGTVKSIDAERGQVVFTNGTVVR
ncbi:hypothetical protein [Chromobacterium haemolyticum]|uniref:hypothetical protein n=1 Tax=Chromobacterium haemolyticum TaxID=394935 RepID=UPI00244CCBF7|nr:hypothetical protein [Chromobacterium haemolyticum]MDH0342005.1 hypothetical protein [Chromobacterium haemolyticum]